MRTLLPAAFVLCLASCSLHSSQPRSLDDSISVTAERARTWIEETKSALKYGGDVVAAEDSATFYTSQLAELQKRRAAGQ